MFSRILKAKSQIAHTLRHYAFDNKSFWNRRYEADLQFGSGPGSRGENLLLKNLIISAEIAKSRISSVLDIGCGDIAILESLTIREYVGIDISRVIIERDRLLRPDWTFVCADLGSSFEPPQADLVLCLDVLIHQRTRRQYITVLSKGLRSARKVALISGYSRPDQEPGYNVFYHEPIDASVRYICPKAKIEKLASYRFLDLIRVEVPSTGPAAASHMC